MFAWFRRRRNKNQRDAGASEGGFRLVQGRRRLANAPYLLASDFEETNRLDMQHYMLRLAFGSNTMAPIQNPQSILDAGCGTGRWARELAMQFPQANVVGIDMVEPNTDIIARQRQEFGDRLPANYLFVQGNVLQGLPFNDNDFDYTHLRFLGLAIPMASWQSLVNDMVRVTRPKGWVEIVEFDIPSGGGPAFTQIQVYWRRLAETYKLHPGAGSNIPGYAQNSGLRNIQQRAVRLNTGDRSSRAARMAAIDLYSGLAASGPAMINAKIVSREEFDQLYQQMREEIQYYSITWDLLAVWGQKA